MDYFIDLLATFLDFYWNISVVLLSMQGQTALRFHQKYLNLCFEDEWRSYRFETTRGWVINDRIFIFGWTNPLRAISFVVWPGKLWTRSAAVADEHVRARGLGIG